MSDKNKDELIDVVKTILSGIDKDGCLNQEGWFTTSTGVEFGARKLDEVVCVIEAWNTRPDQKCTWPGCNCINQNGCKS